MKKIFTLLFFVGAFTTSFAQKANNRKSQYVITKSSNDYKKFDNHRDNIYTFSAKEKDEQIAQINKNFSLKIKTIKNNPFIGRSKKQSMVKNLKIEKAQQIQAVNAKFNSQYNTAYNVYGKKFDNHKH
ncbi:MAG: hypothetical protein ACRDE8_16895 [Ginsengibacter sp.]